MPQPKDLPSRRSFFFFDVTQSTLHPVIDILEQVPVLGVLNEKSDINALLSASENYMLEQQEAAEIIEEVRAAIKDWRKTATTLQIPHKQLGAYSIHWDEL